MNMTIIVRISEDQYYDKATGEHVRIMNFPQPVGISEVDTAAASSLDNVVHNAFKKYEKDLAARAEMHEHMSYAALCKVCGHLCGATVDDSTDHPDRTAMRVAQFIREGLTITRVTDETIRTGLQWCTCPNKSAKVQDDD